MKVLISGAGIAGLALAGFLKDTGIDVTVVEKASTLPQGGFSIALWPNGRRILNKLGIGGVLDEEGVPIKRLVVRDGRGKLLRDYRMSAMDVEFGSSMLNISRAKLLESLYRSALVPVQFGATIDHIEEGKDSVLVHFKDASQDSYDLVVGADGVHSSVRTRVFGIPEQYVNWRIWRMWTEGPIGEPQTMTEYLDPGMCVFVFNEKTRSHISLMARVEHSSWDNEEGRIERLKHIFGKETAIVPGIFTQHTDAEVMPGDLMEVSMRSWHTKRVVLIGDAAHAFLPLAGLGGSVALEDAYVLAGELEQSLRDIPKALANFDRKRRHRIDRVARMNHKMRAWAFVRSRILRLGINMLLPFVSERFIMNDYLALMREEL